jgi:hypothetical protein
MALRRSFIAGLGTTGLLLGFALLLLLVVGALMGFRSWPGDGSVGEASGVSISEARLTQLPPVELPGTDTAKAGAATRAGGQKAAHGSRKRHAHDAQAVAGVRRASGQQVGPAGAGSGGSGPNSSGGGGQGVKGVSDGVAGTVNRVTETAGGKLGGTANPVGNVVVETGSALSETVQDLGVKAQGKPKLP